jgi:hypothetical protein
MAESGGILGPAGRAALNDLRGWPIPLVEPRIRGIPALTSNISQSYPYTSETDAERSAAIAVATGKFTGLADTIAAESEPLPDEGPAEPGQPHRSWVFVCPKHVSGRLHVAGYAREKHALFTVCDEGGETYLR